VENKKCHTLEQPNAGSRFGIGYSQTGNYKPVAGYSFCKSALKRMLKYGALTTNQKQYSFAFSGWP